MSNYKWKTDARTICSGFTGEVIGTSPIINWRDADGSGSQTTDHYLQNRDYSTAKLQTVHINVTTGWSVSFDRNNRMIVHITSRLNEVYSNVGAGGNNTVARRMIIRPKEGGNAAADFTYSANTAGRLHGAADIDSWDLTVNPGADSPLNSFYFVNYSVGYGSESDQCDEYVDKITAGIRFHNNREWIYDDPSISSTSCQPNAGGAKLSYNGDYGATLPNSGTNRTKVEISRNQNFSDIVWSTTVNDRTSNTITIGNGVLSPNTRYYVRYTMINKAGHEDTATCDFVTLARNTLTNPVSVRYDREMLDLAVLNGGAVYDPNTKIYYRQCGTTTWLEGPSSDTKTVRKMLLTGLTANTCYEAQARTTTTAGTYTGDTITFTTAVADRVSGTITSVDAYIDENLETHARIDFKVFGTCTPIRAYLQYRIKNGYSDEWISTEEREYPNEENEDYVILDELLPNQTVYEVRVHAECGVNIGDGEITDFTTPLMNAPENYNCENYQYMVDMICQSLEGIRSGMKTIYANDDVKKLCDPYSENPTFASMWSRVLRFMHGAICVMCDMTDAEMKSGLPGQIYMGEVGWTDMADEVEEDNELPVRSGGVKTAIDASVHEVWHFEGEYSYLVAEPADLANLTLVAENDTALVASNDTVYTYDGSSWVEGEEAHSDDFGVIHLLKGSETAIGRVKADSMWYYFEGTWSYLNADTQELDRQITWAENAPYVRKQSLNEDDIKIQHNAPDFNYASLPSGERVVCFVVERSDIEPATYYSVGFDSDGGTPIPSQIVEEGNTATQPADPVKAGHTFLGWELNGVMYNFNTPVNSNLLLKAAWQKIVYTVSFDPNGGSPTPASQSIPYGDLVVEPTNVVRTGWEIIEWDVNGVAWDFNNPVTSNMTLTAVWDTIKVPVHIDPDNGVDDPYTVLVPYGGTLSGLVAPTKEGWTFDYWVDTDTQQQFNINTPITAETSIIAHYTQIFFTVTFNANGGSPTPAAQTVAYGDLVTVPTPPSKTSYSFLRWELDGQPYDFSAPVHNNLTLVATYVLNYIITFDPNGGTPTPAQQNIIPGNTIIVPTTPTYTGHDFEGWQYNGVDWDFDVPPTGDMQLVAAWSIHQYTVHFDMGSSGAAGPADQLVDYNSNCTNPGTNYTYVDGDNQRWVVDKWLLNGNEYDFSTPVTEDLTLTPHWIKGFEVSFDTDGGTPATLPPQYVAEGGLINQPVDPVKQGKYVAGWEKVENNNNQSE